MSVPTQGQVQMFRPASKHAGRRGESTLFKRRKLRASSGAPFCDARAGCPAGIINKHCVCGPSKAERTCGLSQLFKSCSSCHFSGLQSLPSAQLWHAGPGWPEKVQKAISKSMVFEKAASRNGHPSIFDHTRRVL